MYRDRRSVQDETSDTMSRPDIGCGTPALVHGRIQQKDQSAGVYYDGNRDA
jgi:hypothetical protein